MQELGESLFNRNVNLAYWYVNTYFPNLDGDEDITQEAQIGLWRAAETYKVESGIKFATYACVCMRNQILQELRRRKKQYREIRLEDYLSNEDGLMLCQILRDSKYEIEGSSMELIDYIDRLSNKQMQVILLKWRGMTQGQIGKAVGISQPQCSRILKKIKSDFESL